VPKYYFTVRGPDRDENSESVSLPNLEAALARAEDTIRKQSPSTCDPAATLMIVKDDNQRTVLSLPFLPGCA
jgi:hypothetical protein